MRENITIETVKIGNTPVTLFLEDCFLTMEQNEETNAVTFTPRVFKNRVELLDFMARHENEKTKFGIEDKTRVFTIKATEVVSTP